ncbi:MAG: 23S rRNA (adenine(2030)-N(6))-methyltransferase RlmJ [Paracoccaceae bacterium]
MLSYQHAYHAGNLADLQKHGLLAWMLAYLTRKEKPLSYLETHAGRGIYDLSSSEALKTAEAASGIHAHADWFAADHPVSKCYDATIQAHGPSAYPGSPMIAAHLLRPQDSLHLAELHPGEYQALRDSFRRAAKTYLQDGFEMAHALAPPTPRRGLLLIDPPYEIKSDYTVIPGHVSKLTRAWNVGIIALWYPILTSDAHHPMLDSLSGKFPDALRHEVYFPPARPGHGMIGSGMFVINPPYGLQGEATRLSALFERL